MLNLSQLTAPATPLDYFALLVKSDENFPLLEAAVAVAQDEYETLDVQQVLGSVDQMTAKLKRKLSADAPPLQRLHILNRFFYMEMGFAGNVNDYYAPDNSYLNAVLKTRKGLPITLAIIWLELAASVGVKACGINFPGHFLIKISLPQGQVIMDPLDARSLSGHELAARLEPFHKHLGLEGDFEVPFGLYLQDASSRDIVIRLLRNLKEIYRADTDWDRLVCVQNRLVTLLPEAWHEYRDRGLALAKLRRKDEAVIDLDLYLNKGVDLGDREMVLLTRAQMLA
ncbi:MAG: tetratricopeptide repeat protein [Cytophagales bacterium]|nr:tetratricopeptide repeat protein [Cytophagales bacterium]